MIRFDHLRALTGPHGLYEHARHDAPRQHHGYTTDDNARALVVMARSAPLTEADQELFHRYLEFVASGRVPGGWHNRMSDRGVWLDRRGADDAHGRAMWGLGEAFRVLDAGDRQGVLETFVAGLDLETPSPRANSYAVLGAVAALAALGEAAPPAVEPALRKFISRVPGPARGSWRWPEARLAYANARMPEALLAAGEALGDGAVVASGVELLGWLVALERGEAGFSFTPVGGRGPDDTKPAFDQQPIEAWAMADACARAAWLTGDESWRPLVEDAAEWFLGRNDAGLALYDADTGAGFDGLHRNTVNRNRGAESTLAALGALQTLERCLAGLPPA